MISRRLDSDVEVAGGPSCPPEGLTPEAELRHFKNVIDSMMQDGLETWTEIWGEFDERVVSGVAVLPDAANGFVPRCGWPDFLEKMWQLRLYLSSAKKLCK